MWTGFEDRWDDPPAYLNADAAGRLHYPGFGAEAARWLIEERSIGALGIDTMGIDRGADTSFGDGGVPLMAYVKDASTGTVVVMWGTKEIVTKDTSLASRLLLYTRG